MKTEKKGKKSELEETNASVGVDLPPAEVYVKDKRPKKILVMTNHPGMVTGFGNQIRYIIKGLLDQGHKVIAVGQHTRHLSTVSANFVEGCQFDPITWEPYTDKVVSLNNLIILPHFGENWGRDAVPYYINRFKPDIVLTLGDLWTYGYLGNPAKLPQGADASHYMQRYVSHPWVWIPYLPFDTMNSIPRWDFDISMADHPVVMSQFGTLLAHSHGLKHVNHIPHGHRCDIFKPVDAETKKKLRIKYNLDPDGFYVGIVAHNQFRKEMARSFQAFGKFWEMTGRNPKVKLLAHTEPTQGGQIPGWDLAGIARDNGYSSQVLFSDKAGKCVADIMNSDDAMAELYQVMDVHMLLTGGEGWGLPITESMACGIPNISSWYTTAFEFFGGNQQDTFWKSYSNVFEPTNIRDAGFFSEVEGKLIPDKIKTVRGIGIPLDTVHDHYNGGKWAMANERCAALALKWVYDNPDDAKELGLRGAEHVKQNYAWDVVVPQWIKLIDEVKPNMAEMVEPKKEIDDTRINFIHA